MKKFLRKLFLFLVLFALLVVPINHICKSPIVGKGASVKLLLMIRWVHQIGNIINAQINLFWYFPMGNQRL